MHKVKSFSTTVSKSEPRFATRFLGLPRFNPANLFNLMKILVLTICFSFSAKAQVTVVDSGYCGAYGNNLAWVLTSDSVLTISGSGDMANYGNRNNYVPWYQYRKSINTVIIKTNVTSIGDCAFGDCINLMSITISNSVIKIGIYSFHYCINLTSITLPNSVKWIEALAFSSCVNLTSITLSNNITDIGNNAFSGCASLISISIPNSVKSIGREAFSGCEKLNTITFSYGVASIGDLAFAGCVALTYISLPNSITNIGAGIFAYCTALDSIHVESENNSYASENGILFNKNKTALICCPAGKMGLYIVPNSVTSIADYAFCSCTNLSSITIPNNLTNIGALAFYRCENLISINIPDNVTSIGTRAFGFCTSLTSITLSNKLTNIDEFLFESCASLISIIIPDNVIGIGSSAFENCTNLTTITIPKNITSIQTYAFAYCNNLKLIINFNPLPIDIHFTVFEGLYKGKCTLKVPINSVSNYKNTDIWKEFNIVDIEVGIKNIETIVGKIYPNPTNGQLTIEYSDGACPITTEEYTIYSVMGQIVMRRDAMHCVSTINVESLANGMYYLKIADRVIKFVKE